MSCKAYFFRLRTDDNVDRLGIFLNKYKRKGDAPASAWINYFYLADKDFTPRFWQKEKPAIRKGDILAAITADVGHFYKALIGSGAYNQNKPDPIFFDLEDGLPRQKTEPGSGFLLRDATILDIEPNRSWKSKIKNYFKFAENH